MLRRVALTMFISVAICISLHTYSDAERPLSISVFVYKHCGDIKYIDKQIVAVANGGKVTVYNYKDEEMCAFSYECENESKEVFYANNEMIVLARLRKDILTIIRHYYITSKDYADGRRQDIFDVAMCDANGLVLSREKGVLLVLSFNQYIRIDLINMKIIKRIPKMEIKYGSERAISSVLFYNNGVIIYPYMALSRDEAKMKYNYAVIHKKPWDEEPCENVRKYNENCGGFRDQVQHLGDKWIICKDILTKESPIRIYEGEREVYICDSPMPYNAIICGDGFVYYDINRETCDLLHINPDLQLIKRMQLESNIHRIFVWSRYCIIICDDEIVAVDVESWKISARREIKVKVSECSFNAGMLTFGNNIVKISGGE